MKKQSNLSRLLDYAGSYKILTYLSWVLSAASALLALVPFWYIWRILKEVIETAPQYENAVHVTHYGWMAVVFAVAAVLVYITGLMCSHLAAFRIATNLRLAMTKHIATLPLGAIEQFGSGKLRRTISETAGATETYLAHQLPDKAKAMATIAGLLALLLIFDWRLGLLSLVPVALAFAVMMSMTGKKLQDKMTQYQNALADMSNEAVEYVRGIPVTLFDNSILENIRIGRKDATDEEVIAAAKLANVDKFAEKLPDGWNTNIGENGCDLSGGERQRISIARAFLKNAPIILLDEATASLDVENETAIQEALSRLIRNKTVLIIAHRMRTVSGADKIVVLKDGAVAEQGSPAKLLKEGGVFAHMVQLQTESQSWTLAKA